METKRDQGSAIFKSDRMIFKSKTVTRDNEDHHIMIKR